jgi:hypothetical protein
VRRDPGRGARRLDATSSLGACRRYDGSPRSMRPDELERRLRERLDALGPAPRAELLDVLMLPDFERAGAH